MIGCFGGKQRTSLIIFLFKTFLFIWGCIGFDSKGEVRNGEKQSCLKNGKQINAKVVVMTPASSTVIRLAA